MVADLRYFNSLKNEAGSLKSQLETQKTSFLNEIDRLSREYYYANHMNAILGVYTTLDEFTDLQCDYVDQVVKYKRHEKELLKSNTTSKNFEALQQHAIDLELALQQCQEQIKMTKISKKSVKSKPATFLDSLAKKDFSKSKLVTKNDMSEDFSEPVTAQILPQNVKEPKRTVNQSIATPLERTVDAESTNQKPRSTVRKLYEYVSKTCSWSYPKFTSSGYTWKPKSSTMNVKPNVSMPLGNTSRTTNIPESITLTGSTLSNTPKSSNSFAACRDNSIHHRLWVLKEHDGKSQASK
ncbi:hypothetical protein Tco_0766673 [Tanacetum coccineum]